MMMYKSGVLLTDFVWECQRVQDVSQEIKRVRAKMEENEQLAILMRGLRGQNLKDTLFADDSINLRLVEVTFTTLNYVYLF